MFPIDASIPLSPRGGAGRFDWWTRQIATSLTRNSDKTHRSEALGNDRGGLASTYRDQHPTEIDLSACPTYRVTIIRWLGPIAA